MFVRRSAHDVVLRLGEMLKNPQLAFFFEDLSFRKCRLEDYSLVFFIDH